MGSNEDFYHVGMKNYGSKRRGIGYIYIYGEQNLALVAIIHQWPEG